LKRRTWKETQKEFNISSRTVKNIKDRNSKKNKDISQVDYKKVAKKPTKTIKKTSQSLSIETKKEVKMTLDGLRGLYLLSTGIGDKISSKQILQNKLKNKLLNPKNFGVFLQNLAIFLEEF